MITLTVTREEAKAIEKALAYYGSHKSLDYKEWNVISKLWDIVYAQIKSQEDYNDSTRKSENV